MTAAFFAWSDAFAVGHQELDADHRRLVASIADIAAAVHERRPREELQPLLKGLKLLAEVHFQRENAVLLEIAGGAVESEEGRVQTQAYLEAVGAAALDAHAEQHAMALEQLAAMIAALDSGATEPAKLCLDLKDWFLEHATVHDAHLKSIFQLA